MNLDYQFMVSDFPTVLAALPSTLLLTLYSLIGALIVAVLAGVIEIARIRVLSIVVMAITTFIKGIPLVVQLLFSYYAVPFVAKACDGFLGYSFDPRNVPYFPAAVLALALNFGAYMSDVVVSSYGAVEVGQIEAAKAVGMTQVQTIRRIVLPQMVVISLPNLTNYLVWLLKGTSLASLVNVVEMLTTAKLSAADGYQYLEAYIDAAIIYWAVCAAIEFVSGRFSRRVGGYLQKTAA
jgi:L-cystine transport system permease protein